MTVAAIIQARMTSTRLPGKVLLDLAGKPMLARVVERARRARSLDVVGVATSTEASDDPLAAFCAEHDIPCHRGSLHDLLDRYHGAARAWKADYVVRITSDCPLIDPEVVDRVVNVCVRAGGEVDYASNVLPLRTFPRGLDTEALPFRVLERVWETDKNPGWREHVTEYIHQNPDQFRIECVTNGTDFSQHRWTVDTPEDLELVRRIYRVFRDEPFSWRQVQCLLADRPDWVALNRHVMQKTVGP